MADRREKSISSRRHRQDSFVFEVTTRCNHDCLHCYNAWKDAAPYPEAGELPLAETLDMLDLMLEETGAGLVTLSGGEPLLRPDIFEIVDHIAERKLAINFICNGTLLNEEAVKRLAAPKGKVSIFELPLLSSERAIHDRLSGVPGAFDRMTAAVAELKLAGARVVTVFVATKLNLQTWRETIELAVALGADGLMFNRFNPGGRGRENIALLQASPEELQAAMDVAEEMSEKYGISISCSIAMPPCLFDVKKYKKLTFGFCAAGTDRAYYTLDPAGNVRPCNHSPTILGNIRETSFREMAEGRAMKRYRQARPAFCRGCKLEMECLGGCKAAAEACSGSEWDSDPFLAAYKSRAKKIEV
jgi:radical SAM protein with 4Fe4S-binding SPASM domain